MVRCTQLGRVQAEKINNSTFRANRSRNFVIFKVPTQYLLKILQRKKKEEKKCGISEGGRRKNFVFTSFLCCVLGFVFVFFSLFYFVWFIVAVFFVVVTCNIL